MIVVDSLGSGAVAKLAEDQGWPVHYINADKNLGSAGNLDLRLRTAADLGLEWCLALNHDAELDVSKAQKLLEHGRSRPKVGAVYPQLIFTAAGGRRRSSSAELHALRHARAARNRPQRCLHRGGLEEFQRSLYRLELRARG